MQEAIALAGIVGALSVGVISPGPSFVMVARMAVATSRRHGVSAAFGMGAGGMLFAAAALLGLQAVFLAVPSVYLGLKVLGGVYLGYLGIRIFMAAKLPLAMESEGQNGEVHVSRSFWLGFSTQISNPKTAIVYASVFAAFLPPAFSSVFAAVLLCIVFAIETVWYSVVATLLSSPGPKRIYLNFKAWVDRTAGFVLFGLGLKLVVSAHDA